MTSTAVAVTVGAAPAVIIFVEFLKRWLETWLKPTDPRHDITIQVMALVVGVVIFVGDAAIRGVLTRAGLSDLIVQGAAAAGLAIGGYHFLPTTSTVPTTPVAIPANYFATLGPISVPAAPMSPPSTQA